MFNDSKVVKHFKEVWKNGRVLVENSDPGYLISDINIVLRVSPGLKLFNDREMFPELPGPGESYMYGKHFGFRKDGPKIKKLIESFLKSELVEVHATPWRHRDAVLVRGGQKYQFLDQRFLDLFNGNYTGLCKLEKRHEPVIYGGTTVEKVFAVLMPMRVDLAEQADRFPNIPELIEG